MTTWSCNKLSYNFFKSFFALSLLHDSSHHSFNPFGNEVTSSCNLSGYVISIISMLMLPHFFDSLGSASDRQYNKAWGRDKDVCDQRLGANISQEEWARIRSKSLQPNENSYSGNLTHFTRPIHILSEISTCSCSKALTEVTAATMTQFWPWYSVHWTFA